ncbi:MAG: HAMP domain-containing histidine kinase [Dehalococcoidia bacterium]|nr:HAMP domain-containing histidine kinase [Dehalococcoidia bacterium]
MEERVRERTQRLEEQNHELTIQNALERVRARALGMQTSDELDEVSAVLFEVLGELSYDTFWCVIGLIDESTDRFTISGKIVGAEIAVQCTAPLRASMEASPTTRSIVEAWRRKDESYALEVTGQAIADHLGFWEPILEETNPGYRFPRTFSEADTIFQFGSYFPDGLIEVGTPEAITQEDQDVLKRFSQGFEFAYSRFLELKLKEDQNRELEIERSLERVRTVVAGMQQSQDLTAVLQQIRESLTTLDFDFLWTGINIFDLEQGLVHVSFAVGDAVTCTLRLEDVLAQVVPFSDYMEHWRRQEVYHHSYELKEAEGYLDNMAGLPGFDAAYRETFGISVADVVPKVQAAGGLTEIDVPFTQGSFYVSRLGLDALSAADTSLLERFTEVLVLGYRRHLDLQAAEERASLSAREAGYERVRSAVLASRSTDDILAVAELMGEELRQLGVRLTHAGINVIDEEADEWRGFAVIAETVRLDARREVVAHFRRAEPYMRPARYTEADFQAAAERDGEAAARRLRRVKVIVDVPFTYGTLAMNSNEVDEFSQEEIAILQGFADPISLAYTRYLDFQRLEEQNREILENTRNKSQFLRRMSHDLRSPMNAIIGYSRLLRRRTADRLDEREQRNLANIETSSGNLLNLINDILDLSRIEAGRIEVNSQPMDPRVLANECADALESIVKDGVTLIRDLADVGQISSDPDRLRQVVMNLFGNATKFTESGSITLSLKRVAPKSDPAGNGAIELSIADTGIGIPEEDLPHIFDEFRQVERQGGEQEGTGLGLAIAKKTVDLLGGQISATSEVGKGTTFTVTLNDAGAGDDG